MTISGFRQGKMRFKRIFRDSMANASVRHKYVLLTVSVNGSETHGNVREFTDACKTISGFRKGKKRFKRISHVSTALTSVLYECFLLTVSVKRSETIGNVS